MTHVRVTKYVEVWLGQSIMSLHPGVFSYMFVKDMMGEEFMRERLADGTLLPLDLDEVHS